MNTELTVLTSARGSQRVVAGLSLAIVVIASVALYSHRIVPDSIALLGLCIIWIGLLPGIIYLFLANRPPVPFMPAAGAYYAVFFGLPVFTIPLAWKDASSIIIDISIQIREIRPEVLFIVALGIGAFISVFYVSRYLFFRRFFRFHLPQSDNYDIYRPLLWVLLCSHILYMLVPALSAIPSIGQFFGPVGYLAFGGLFILWRRGRVSNIEALVLISLFLPLEFYFRIRFLFLTDIILFLVFAMLILWRERMSKTLGICGVLAILILSVYGTSNVIRSSSLTISEKLSTTVVSFLALIISNENIFKNDKGNRFAFAGQFGDLTKRTGQLWVFHVVDNKSPEPVPYWGGQSYRPLLTSFIPRVVYPNKPEERAGGEFGKRYGFIQPNNYTTSINIPWITEFLVNFGRWGVVWGMALIGIFIAFLDRFFNSRDATDMEFIVGLTIIFPLVYPESNFSVMTGSMLPLFISLYVYFVAGAWLLSKLRNFKNR